MDKSENDTILLTYPILPKRRVTYSEYNKRVLRSKFSLTVKLYNLETKKRYPSLYAFNSITGKWYDILEEKNTNIPIKGTGWKYRFKTELNKKPKR